MKKLEQVCERTKTTVKKFKFTQAFIIHRSIYEYSNYTFETLNFEVTNENAGETV